MSNSSMPNLRPSVLRSLHVIAGLAALSFAAACGKNGGGAERVNTRPATNNQSTVESLLGTAFNKGYDRNDAANMALARRIEGASAWVKTPAQQISDQKNYDVQVQILVSDENKNNPAMIISAAGQTFWGEEKSVQKMETLVEGEKTPTQGVAPSKTRAPRLKLMGDTSPEAVERFRVQSVCLNEACSQLAVRLIELLSADQKAASEGKAAARAYRQVAFIFHRRGEKNATEVEDGPLELFWVANTDAKNFNSGVKQSFEKAVASREEKTLPISKSSDASQPGVISKPGQEVVGPDGGPLGGAKPGLEADPEGKSNPEKPAGADALTSEELARLQAQAEKQDKSPIAPKAPVDGDTKETEGTQAEPVPAEIPEAPVK